MQSIYRLAVLDWGQLIVHLGSIDGVTHYVPKSQVSLSRNIVLTSCS